MDNETRGENVFFDNLVMQHYTGPLSETNDYTPWGLGLKMLRSKAFGRIENKRGYNGNELQNSEFVDRTGLDWYDFNARIYDQQLGRFWQTDPETESENQEPWAQYHFTFNNLVRYSDPDGKVPIVPVLVWGWRAYKAWRLIQRASGTQTVTLAARGSMRAILRGAVDLRRLQASKANEGASGAHGGNSHDEAINNRVQQLKNEKGVTNIRKNQAQVDVNGNKVGNNRPDLQFDQKDPKTGERKHYNVEFDTKPSNSTRHGNQIRKNDPNSAVELNVLPGN